jgi:hypothetical protein
MMLQNQGSRVPMSLKTGIQRRGEPTASIVVTPMAMGYASVHT